MRKKYEAYFTAEAALVLPVVFGCLLLVVCLGLFQYDRCALEQKLNLSTLLSVSADVKSSEERVQASQVYWAKKDERFPAFELKDIHFSLKKGKIRSELYGVLELPSLKLPVFQSFLLWEVRAKSEGEILNPVLFVRNYKKIMGGL